MIRNHWGAALLAAAGALLAGGTVRAGDTVRLVLDPADSAPTKTLGGADARDADTVAVGHHYHGGYHHGGWGGHYHHGGWGGYRGYYGLGYGGYRPWYGYGYRGWYGGYRPWYGYGYRWAGFGLGIAALATGWYPGYYSGWYPGYYGYGYPLYDSSYCYPSTTILDETIVYPSPSTLRVVPPAAAPVMPPAASETAPLPREVPADGTFPYDGGPRPPAPKAVPAPTAAPAGRGKIEGRQVSLPARPKKLTYPAYGEEPRERPQRVPFAADRTLLILNSPAPR